MLKLKVVLFCLLKPNESCESAQGLSPTKGEVRYTGKQYAPSHIFGKSFLSYCLPLSFLLKVFVTAQANLFLFFDTPSQKKPKIVKQTDAFGFVLYSGVAGFRSITFSVSHSVSQYFKLF